MSDEKQNYTDYEKYPIPTYDEAVEASSSTSNLRRDEQGNNEERQGLLGTDSIPGAPRRRNGYQAPSVQSVRSSEDSNFTSPEVNGSDDEGGEDAALRHEMEQLEIGDEESGDPRARRRARLQMNFSKRLSRIRSTFSGISLPSFSFVTSRIPHIPDRYRPGWAILAKLAGLFIVITLLYAFFVFEIYPMRRAESAMEFNPEFIRSTAQGAVNKERIRQDLLHISGYDHVAGSQGSYSLGEHIKKVMQESNMDAVGFEELRFDVYLNYPKAGGRKVAIVEPEDLKWEARLEEDPVYDEFLDKKDRQQTPVFHGLSRSGDATGPLIYANYGSKKDIKSLYDSGIAVNGSIMIMRYYGGQTDRGMKCKEAESWGAVGCIIYSDPADDGFVKGEVWPNGRWRPSDGVQRGTVALTSWITGDVLTPGLPSDYSTARIEKEGNPALVQIPSIPLAWRDAQKLLQAIKGHGQELPEEWRGGVPDIDEWWSGDLSSPKVYLQNYQDEVEKQPIYNVMGQILGVEESRKVFVGNHRDSWCFGAGDPGSGTAVMLEVIRILGTLRDLGWRPLRTIEFASWDAEEYNLIGSTEYVEANIAELRKSAIAYLNVDVGVVGDSLWAAGNPLFSAPWYRVLKRVVDPVKNVTLEQLWRDRNGQIEGLGAGSDHVPFQDLAGCASFDFGFRGPEHGFPYHSCYETFEWMQKFGDPNFDYHATLAQIWVLLILELSQEPILPFDFPSYASSVKTWANDLGDYANTMGAPWVPNEDGIMFDTAPLIQATMKFEQEAAEFDKWKEYWGSQVWGRGGYESNAVAIQRMSHNIMMSNFDTHLLDWPWDGIDDGEQHGIPGREQYKHVIFGPELYSSYDAAYFTAVRDAIDVGNWTLAQKQLEKAANILSKASEQLGH